MSAILSDSHQSPPENAVQALLAHEQRANFGTLAIDGRGVVISCSNSGLKMFGGKLCDIEGSPIRSLITNITPSDTSPSYYTRYINYLSKNPNWHRFQAVDVLGQCFPVDILLSKIIIENDDVFLLNLRRPLE